MTDPDQCSYEVHPSVMYDLADDHFDGLLDLPAMSPRPGGWVEDLIRRSGTEEGQP